MTVCLKKRGLGKNYHRFWEIRSLFGNQNDTLTKFFSLVEHLAVGKLFFRHYILRELDEMLSFYSPYDMADCNYKITI
jgi:hypothetical protein